MFNVTPGITSLSAWDGETQIFELDVPVRAATATQVFVGPLPR